MFARVSQAMERAFVALVAMALGFLLLGCEMYPLPGVSDVAIELASAAPEKDAAALRRAVLQRLAAARIAADVDIDGSRVRVVVDAQTEPDARELLGWPGGLAVHAEAPDETPLVDRPERVNTAAKAAASAPTGNVRRLFQPLGADRARLRAVETKPKLVLEPSNIETIEVTADGKSLRVELDPRTRDAFRSLETGGPGPLWVVRDDTVLGPLGERTESSFVVPVGEGLYAYTRADRLRALLTTPPLPKLEHVSTTALPFSPMMLVIGLSLSLGLSLAWLAFVRRFDRLHPEPLWLVMTVFALGALSVIPAAVLEVAWARAHIAFNPTYASMGGRLSAFPYSLAVFTVVVGLSEEGSKLLAAVVVRRRREFDEPIDGIVYGVAAALGFAAVENLKYFATGRLAPSLIVARTFTSIPAHLFFGALWGYALGQTLLPGRGKGVVLKALALAALLHGAFDALLSTRGLAPLALLLNLGLASAFVLLVQKSLRRAAVDVDAAPLSVDRHAVVRVGSPTLFWLGAVAVHVGALSSVILGVMFESGGARPGIWFYVAASTSLAVVVVGAWILSSSVPLDVVVDAHGVTFAGSFRRWELIERIERVRLGSMSYLRVTSTEGELRIGPIRPADAITLDALLASRLVPT